MTGEQLIVVGIVEIHSLYLFVRSVEIWGFMLQMSQ